MTSFTKVIRIGTQKNLGSLFCKISLSEDGNLSISGVEGPKSNGDAFGCCGQINMHEWEIDVYAPGWSAELVNKFRSIWEKYHLNDMKAGSPSQRDYLEANPVVVIYPDNHYNKACDALKNARLNPDPNFLHNGKPYVYGSAWLKIEVPEDVIEFLKNLPDTDVKPAWV